MNIRGMKISCMKMNLSCMAVSSLMDENDIFMHGNESFAPKGIPSVKVFGAKLMFIFMHENFISLLENYIFMYENDISMHGNKSYAPKEFHP